MNGPPLQGALECLKLITQRRFFAQTKEQFALVVVGTDATDNALAGEDGKFSHITLVRELSPLDWDILETLNNGFEATNQTGDLIDAIVVGVQHLATASTKHGSERNIIVLSNLEGTMSTSQMDEVIRSLQQAKINLDILGLDIPQGGDQKPETDDTAGPSNRKAFSVQMRERVAAFSQLLEALEGRCFTFDEAIPALSLFENRGVGQRPWRVQLEIGETLRIPLTGFTLVRESRPPPLENVFARDPNVGISAVTTYHLNDDVQTQIDAGDTVRGLRYGATLVPFSKEDMDKLKQPAEKCLSVIGFTKSENVPHNLYVGNNVMMFVADAKESIREDDAEATQPAVLAVSALAQALRDLDSVALVRRIYSRASAPVLGALIPRIDASVTGLVYHELAFREDIRAFTFRSLPTTVTSTDENGASEATPVEQQNEDPSNEKYKPTKEQLEAMDDFVSNMMLVGQSEDENEDVHDDSGMESRPPTGLSATITPERTPNPWIQRFYGLIGKRGLGNDLFPGASTATSSDASDWPIITPSSFPGLEDAISAVQRELDTPETAFRHALREVNRVMPPVVATDVCTVLPSEKRKGHLDDTEAIKRKRRAMASDLFGIKPDEHNEGMDEPSGSTDSSAAPEGLRIGSVDPLGDFNELLRQNLQEDATRQLEEHIRRLVDDPLTAGLLRPKATLCVRAYREAAQAVGAAPSLPDAYNAFLREWRRGLETDCPPNRRAFWNEVLVQDDNLKPILNAQMTGEEANDLMKPSRGSAKPGADERPAPSQPPSSIDDLLQPYACKGGVEIFNCPLCPVADIATRAHLTTHLQKHQINQKRGDGKHVCCFCASELSSNSSLERHLLTHTNHRPFTCSLCDKAFTTNGNLSRHQRTSHQSCQLTDSIFYLPLKIDSPSQEKRRIQCCRAMIFASQKKSIAIGQKHQKTPTNTRIISERVIKQRRRFLGYIKHLQKKRLLRSMSAEDATEVLDLSYKPSPPDSADQPPMCTPQPPPPLPINPYFLFPPHLNFLHSHLLSTPPQLHPQPPPLNPSSHAWVPMMAPPLATNILCSSKDLNPLLIARKKNSYKDAPKLITCPVEGCNQKFPWNSSLKRHILTHTPHKPFSCTRCNKAFSTKSNRERHMERVHRVSLKRQRTGDTSNSNCSNINDINCDTEELREEEIASMEGNDRQAEDISNDLLRTAGSPLVEPNPERFANSETLMAANNEREQFTCLVCTKQFTLRHSLRRHMKTHS